jgi:hypothetical protein
MEKRPDVENTDDLRMFQRVGRKSSQVESVFLRSSHQSSTVPPLLVALFADRSIPAVLGSNAHDLEVSFTNVEVSSSTIRYLAQDLEWF